MLKKWEESNGKLNLELSESSMDRVGRKTAYPGDFASSVRGTSVQNPVNNKIDPFAHLTPVARRFIENNEIVRTTKANSQNPSRRVNLSGTEQKRHTPNNITSSRINPSDASYSPRVADLQPAGTNITKFTTTVMGPFRSKGGYSAPEQKKRDLGYSDVAHGPLFNSRIATAANSSESNRTSPYSMKHKAQLPNVSKQRVQIKSSERQNQITQQPYPNAIAGNFGSNRSSNSSSKRRDIPKYPNSSFQVMNNFIQTSYGGMGNLNQTQIMNKTGYGALMYENKIVPAQTNTSRANKKYRITNFYPQSQSANGGGNAMYLKKGNKNLFNIYKAKQQERKKSPGSGTGRPQIR